MAEKTLLARVHLKCASALHEEATNDARMCKQLRQLTILQNVLRKSQERTQKLQQEVDGTGGIGVDEFDSCDLYETVEVLGKSLELFGAEPEVENTHGLSGQSVFDPTLIPPDFAAFKVVDLFRDLVSPGSMTLGDRDDTLSR